jgi:hypothetical protein
MPRAENAGGVAVIPSRDDPDDQRIAVTAGVLTSTVMPPGAFW